MKLNSKDPNRELRAERKGDGYILRERVRYTLRGYSKAKRYEQRIFISDAELVRLWRLRNADTLDQGLSLKPKAVLRHEAVVKELAECSHDIACPTRVGQDVLAELLNITSG